MARTQVPAFDSRDEDDRPVAELGLEVRGRQRDRRRRTLPRYRPQGKQGSRDTSSSQPTRRCSGQGGAAIGRLEPTEV